MRKPTGSPGPRRAGLHLRGVQDAWQALPRQADEVEARIARLQREPTGTIVPGGPR